MPKARLNYFLVLLFLSLLGVLGNYLNLPLFFGVSFISYPQRVSQIIVNLISNAIKFSAENEVVEVSCVCDGTTVNFSVKDTGVGIPEQFKAQIF